MVCAAFGGSGELAASVLALVPLVTETRSLVSVPIVRAFLFLVIYFLFAYVRTGTRPCTLRLTKDVRRSANSS